MCNKHMPGYDETLSAYETLICSTSLSSFRFLRSDKSELRMVGIVLFDEFYFLL